MTGEKRGAGGRGGGGRGGGKKGKWFGGAGGGAGSLPHGSSGVLVTCDSGRGRVTCHQLVEVFEELLEPHLPTAPTRGAAAASAGEAAAAPSVDALLSSELVRASLHSARPCLTRNQTELKDTSGARFVLCDGGSSKGLTYIRLAGGAANCPLPISELVKQTLRAARDSGRSRAKFAQRVLPVETVCYASVSEICKAFAPLLIRHFGAPGAEATAALPAKKFSIVFEARSCDGLKLDRMEVITALAQLISPPHSVCLDAPDLVVMVQVVKSAAALSVVDDYYSLLKYNLRSLTTPPEEREAAKTKAAGAAEDGSAEKAEDDAEVGEGEVGEGEVGEGDAEKVEP